MELKLVDCSFCRLAKFHICDYQCEFNMIWDGFNTGSYHWLLVSLTQVDRIFVLIYVISLNLISGSVAFQPLLLNV